MDEFQRKSLKHMDEPHDEFQEKGTSQKNKIYGRRASRRILKQNLLNDFENALLENPKSMEYMDLEDFGAEE